MLCYKYDIFICHAVEDRAVTEAVYKGLKQAGFKVWYSGVDMLVGHDLDSILKDIIPRCRFGVLILSEAFMVSGWTVRELYVLQQRKSKNTILPVLHKVSATEVRARFPFLGMDHFATNTQKGTDKILEELIKAIRHYKRTARYRYITALTVIFLLMVPAIVFWKKGVDRAWQGSSQVRKEQEQELMGLVETRVKDFQEKLLNEYSAKIRDHNGKLIEKSELIILYNGFTARKSGHRNEYHFTNGYTRINGRKNFPKAGLSLPEEAPYLAHGLQKYKCYLLQDGSENEAGTLSYLFINDAGVEFGKKNARYLNDSSVQIQVQFTESMRCVYTEVHASGKNAEKIRSRLYFSGFKPLESYTFRKRKDNWMLLSVD